MLGDPIKLMVAIANYVYRSLFMPLEEKFKFTTRIVFLVISNILQLKILKSQVQISHKFDDIINVIQFHLRCEIPHVYGHLQLGCNYIDGIQNHTTCWSLILTCGNIWLINPL
jgi:hypothetical protein